MTKHITCRENSLTLDRATAYLDQLIDVTCGEWKRTKTCEAFDRYVDAHQVFTWHVEGLG